MRRWALHKHSGTNVRVFGVRAWKAMHCAYQEDRERESVLRKFGCCWSQGTVTLLKEPDNGDHCKSLGKITPDQALILANDLERCANWARMNEVIVGSTGGS